MRTSDFILNIDRKENFFICECFFTQLILYISDCPIDYTFCYDFGIMSVNNIFDNTLIARCHQLYYCPFLESVSDIFSNNITPLRSGNIAKNGNE